MDLDGCSNTSCPQEFISEVNGPLLKFTYTFFLLGSMPGKNKKLVPLTKIVLVAKNETTITIGKTEILKVGLTSIVGMECLPVYE